MTKLIKSYGLLAVLVVLAALAIHDARDSAASEALALRQLQDARIVASAAREDAGRALAREQAAQDFAEDMKSVVEDAMQRAEDAEQLYETESSIFWAAIENAPDTCKTVVKSATASIASLERANEALHEAVDAATLRGDTLEVALDTTSAALRKLREADARLDTATTQAIKAVRPSLLDRLKPKLGVGFAFGLDSEHKPRAVFGITAGWRF